MNLNQILNAFAVCMSREDSEFPADVMNLRGSFNVNNGTLAIVDIDANVWLARLSIFSDRAIDGGSMPLEIVPLWKGKYRNGQFLLHMLDELGYEQLGFWVPHSNDCGTWMKAHSPITQAQLIADMLQEKHMNEAEMRVQYIRMYFQNSQ